MMTSVTESLFAEANGGQLIAAERASTFAKKVTKHTFPQGRCGSVRRCEGDGCLGFGVVHTSRNNKPQRPVQSPSWRPQPLNLDANHPPLRFVGFEVPFADRFKQVQRTSVSEVQPRPTHRDIVLQVAP